MAWNLTQFSGAEVESENCKYGICALSCAPPRFGLLKYCRRFVQYGVRNCEITFGSILLFHRCHQLAWRCIKLQWRQKVGSCSAHAKLDFVEWGNTEWGNNGCRVRQHWELGVRFWLFGPHWNSCEKKWCNVRCFTATYKNKKFQRGAFLLSTLPPHLMLTELSKVFQAWYFNFAQMKACVELCTNKLSDTAAKSGLKANCEKFDSE